MKLIKIEGKVTLLSATIFLLFANYARAQFINNGGSVTVTAGATLYCDDSLKNIINGTIINNGTVQTNGNIINNAGASLSGDGTYSMQGNFINNGTFDEGNSILYFFGTGNSTIKNKSGNINILQVEKNANKFVSLLDNEKITTSVIFLKNKNWVQLNDNILTFAPGCTIENFSNQRYFLTNGSGSLKKLNVKNTPFIFPVGFKKNSYNPLTITESGTPDAYSVRCLEHAMLKGGSGNPISTDGIDVSWEVSQANAGGADAIIQAEWKTTDELTDFDYTNCMLVRYAGGKWDFVANKAGTATGSPYRTIGRSDFSAVGYFTVLSKKNPTFANSDFSESNAFANNSTGDLRLKVYPTLVQNSLNINVLNSNKQLQKMNVSIVDVNGKTVWQKQHADFYSQKITLPNLTPGMYNVLIQYGNDKFVQKIIISK